MSVAANAILIFDRSTKTLLCEVIPSSFEEENLILGSLLNGQGMIKVPLQLYWSMTGTDTANWVAANSW